MRPDDQEEAQGNNGEEVQATEAEQAPEDTAPAAEVATDVETYEQEAAESQGNDAEAS